MSTLTEVIGNTNQLVKSATKILVHGYLILFFCLVILAADFFDAYIFPNDLTVSTFVTIWGLVIGYISFKTIKSIQLFIKVRSDLKSIPETLEKLRTKENC